MKNHKSIAAVIPLFNKEYKVKACIESVIQQTILPSELIIVDDGSTDSSLEIVKRVLSNFQGYYLILEQKNSGVSAARNAGVKASKSDFIAFLDADDEWYPQFIEKSLALTSDYPDANLYCFAHEVNDPQVGIFKRKHAFPLGFRGYVDDFFESSIKGEIANSSKVTVRKQALIDIGGYPEGANICEDIFVWMKLAMNGKVVFDSYVATLVNQFPDKSRNYRYTQIPYPIVYFTENKNYQQLTISAKKYLWRVYYLHIIGAIMNNQKKQAFKMIQVGIKLFSIPSLLLIITLLIPSKLFIILRNIKRKREI